jgi:hypothetical protein
VRCEDPLTAPPIDEADLLPERCPDCGKPFDEKSTPVVVREIVVNDREHLERLRAAGFGRSIGG